MFRVAVHTFMPGDEVIMVKCYLWPQKCWLSDWYNGSCDIIFWGQDWMGLVVVSMLQEICYGSSVSPVHKSNVWMHGYMRDYMSIWIIIVTHKSSCLSHGVLCTMIGQHKPWFTIWCWSCEHLEHHGKKYFSLVKLYQVFWQTDWLDTGDTML